MTLARVSVAILEERYVFRRNGRELKPQILKASKKFKINGCLR